MQTSSLYLSRTEVIRVFRAHVQLLPSRWRWGRLCPCGNFKGNDPSLPFCPVAWKSTLKSAPGMNCTGFGVSELPFHSAWCRANGTGEPGAVVTVSGSGSQKCFRRVRGGQVVCTP